MDMELVVLEDIIPELKNRFGTRGQLLSLDGVSGAGQKSIADKLAKQFSCEVIEIDGKTDVKKLKKDIEARQSKGSVIVSGIWMRKIMTEAGVKVDVSIYVVPSQVNSRHTFWEGILSKPLPVYLAELKSDLDKATVEYHWKFHPIINADYLVEGD